MLTKSIILPDDVLRILKILNNNGFAAYIVGGCVRDSLLGLTPKDWDICTSASPHDIKNCFDCFKTVDTGIKHGTVTVITEGGMYEVTTYRIDSSYSDGRHPDNIQFVDSILLDLARRDFTMNAIAYHPSKGFIDPYHGIDDLRYGMIYCVNDPDKRFNEDGLRILRALRFAANYGFIISSDVKASIFRNISMLDKISKERINSELCKILCGSNAFNVLIDYKHIFGHIIPELSECIGFNQNNPYHMYDVYDHMMHALSFYDGHDLIIKLALFLHDIGKPLCYTEDERGGHFYGHASVCAELANTIMRRLKFDNQTRNKVVELIKYHDAEIPRSAKSIRKWITKVSYEQFSRMMEIKRCDILAHSPKNQASRLALYTDCMNMLNQIEQDDNCFAIKDLVISGTDVMALGYPQGPIIGKILNSCLDAVVCNQVSNDKQSLSNYIITKFK